MAEYTEWTQELADALREPFPDAAHKTLSKGGTDITYVAWPDYVEKLDALVGPHGWQISTSLHDAGGRLIVTASLSILGVTKSNVGDEEEDKSGFGTPATNAYAQALKRAAALFGVGLYMYDKSGKAKPKPKRNGSPPVDHGPDIPIIPSGQYQGKKLNDTGIPLSYLLSSKDRMPPKWKKAFEEEIERRGVKA